MDFIFFFNRNVLIIADIIRVFLLFVIYKLRLNIALYNIYRPLQSTAKSRLTSTFFQFFEEFKTRISIVSTSLHKFVNTGDFNINVDDPSDSNATQFLSLPDDANLIQHVNCPTHHHSHTLDLVTSQLYIITYSHLFTCFSNRSLSHHLFSQHHSVSWCSHNQTPVSCYFLYRCDSVWTWHSLFSFHHTSSFWSFWPCWTL